MPYFRARVRFNWGYHDAVEAHQRRYPNFGFGTALTITVPGDVVRQHHDHAYAIGWLYGYNAAVRGAAQPLSDEAWFEAVNHGDITP